MNLTSQHRQRHSTSTYSRITDSERQTVTGLLLEIPHKVVLRAAFHEIENRTRDRLYVDGRWVMDYVRLRFRALRT